MASRDCLSHAPHARGFTRIHLPDLTFTKHTLLIMRSCANIPQPIKQQSWVLRTRSLMAATFRSSCTLPSGTWATRFTVRRRESHAGTPGSLARVINPLECCRFCSRFNSRRHPEQKGPECRGRQDGRSRHDDRDAPAWRRHRLLVPHLDHRLQLPAVLRYGGPHEADGTQDEDVGLRRDAPRGLLLGRGALVVRPRPQRGLGHLWPDRQGG